MITNIIESTGISGIQVTLNLADLMLLEQHITCKLQARDYAHSLEEQRLEKLRQAKNAEDSTYPKDGNWSERNTWETNWNNTWAISRGYDSYDQFKSDYGYCIQGVEIEMLTSFLKKLQLPESFAATIFD